LFDYTNVKRLSHYLVDTYTVEIQNQLQTNNVRSLDKEISTNNIGTSTETKPQYQPQNPLSPEILREQVAQIILKYLSETLEMAEANIDPQVSFSDYGIDSILGVGFIEEIAKALGISMNTAILFDYTNVKRLSHYLVDTYTVEIQNQLQTNNVRSLDKEISTNNIGISTETKLESRVSQMPSNEYTETKLESQMSQIPSNEYKPEICKEIAVIGMSGQFPKAQDIDTFWQNLIQGHDGVGELPANYLNPDLFSPDKQAGKTDCKWGGILECRDCFDPIFFNITPREAESMSSHQRLILSESWKALEDAGCNPKDLENSHVSVFIGAEPANYTHETFTGSSDAIVASRLSYYLNLKGPALVVNTGCSSSALAIHLACESLRCGESRIALAGGVFAAMQEKALITLSQIDMLSSTGRCRTFDRFCDGTVLSEGVGMVVLKPLSDAIKDKDPIYGVIQASGANQDGASNGITAPSGLSQEELITSVYRQYQINPETISYFEAHGTGTRLGDTVEANALKRAFKQFTDKTQFCALGSAKSHIGHTGAASGVIGLIKVLLSIYHRQLPKLLHFEELNPAIELENSAFYINTQNSEWTNKGGPLTAALNSFGHSGTNVHLVVREHQSVGQVKVEADSALVPLSAKTPECLQAYAEKLAMFLENRGLSKKTGEEFSLTDLAFTLQLGREAMRERCIFLARNIPDLIAQLKVFAKDKTLKDLSWYWRVGHRKNNDDRSQKIIAQWTEQGKLEKVAVAWVEGQSIDWSVFYRDRKLTPHKIHAPTYPFAQEHYWKPEEQSITQKTTAPETRPVTFGTLLLKPSWIEQSIENSGSIMQYSRHLVILCEPDGITQESITGRMETLDCLVLQSPSKNIAERFHSYASQLFTEIQQLLKDKQETKILLQLVIRDLPEHQLFAGLAGLLMTAHLENPNLVGQLLTVGANDNAKNIVAKLKINAQTPLDRHINYHNGKRRIARWKEIQISNEQVSIPWKEKGKYLITGGLGGVGLIFSQEIAQQICNGTIILAGRSTLDETKRQRLQTLQQFCSQSRTHLEYRQVNVCDPQQVAKLIEDINQDFGHLDGIIHAAGVIQDNFIIKKMPQELEKVLAPKVMGLVNLDQATKDQPLDFFFFCSSLAGGIGNVGQADYACANAFMDSYAQYRNQLLHSHQRQGRTLSINWPLWQEGGMRVDEAIAKMMAQSIGLIAMPTEFGIRALYQAFASNQDRVMVLWGDLAKLKPSFLNLPEKTVLSIIGDVKSALGSEQLQQKTLGKLKALFAETTKLPLHRVDAEEPLESYGIDSIMIAQLNQRLTEGLGSVSKTLFYEFQTLADLAYHLAVTYSVACLQWTDLNTSLATPDVKVESVKTEPIKSQLANENSAQILNVVTKQAIAIIGLSGRYPKAKTIADFWHNLKNGEQCISEIPSQRWDWQRHYHANPSEAVKLGKSYSKWGGFLEDFDQFDPMFFNMTPREAENIDPQERIFLQESWKALEDAGYSPSNLHADLRQRTGVFAGITKQGFNLYRTELQQSNQNATRRIECPATSFASLVNRVSYFLNLQGPSFSVDTMCSSSLVAIHEACEYIRSGNGDMAVVGGVNLYVHPSSYFELSLGQFVSSGSTCAAFETDGDGFVPGEGVGVVILKSYDRALKDRDRIYALIRGTAVNHDGKTNGYKTPNPGPKAAVIRQALQDSGIDARSISYIEAAAQGSDMGDAIEASALTEVFGDRTNVEGAYRIGSVKPNIGHSESASGMSQLTKVILSLKHKTLVPTLRSRELSPTIDFERLPFKLQQDLSEWKPVRVDGIEVPRRAGVMNIGAGGVNAHIIVEEYLGNPEPVNDQQEPVLFVLSAKNEECLEQYVQDWLIYLKNNQNLDLPSIAYTLQVGRESMACRLAFVVKQSVEIEQHLTRWLKNLELSELGFYGDVTKEKIKNPEAVAALVQEGDANNARELAVLWVQGNTIMWDQWHGGKTLGRLSGLPTYPFAKRTCWIVRHDNEHPEGENSLEKSEVAQNINQSLDENKAVEFYTRMSQDCDEEFQEEYLTFGAFPKKIPGFSMTRVAMNAHKYPEELEMIKERQRELRQVLFYREHFDRIQTFLDIGCGHGTDVIQVAALYPHIQTHGFTITESQAILGKRRIENMNLGSRARIYHKDSSKDQLPDNCDIILGVEVTFHIRDKDALFQKMADALSDNGKILLMDYICNLRGSIIDPSVEISIPTQQQWIDLLSEHDLIIDEIIDVSTEISNYLYDPEHAEHTKHLPKVSQDSYRNYANQAISLEKGWITYCLLKLKKDTRRSEQKRREYNAQQIANQTPYAQALDEMLRIGHIPYPPSGGIKMVNLAVNKPVDIHKPPALAQSVYEPEPLKNTLKAIFVNVLGFEAGELKFIERLQLRELGVNSVNAMELLEAINTEFDLHLPTSLIFECHSLQDLAGHIQVELEQRTIASVTQTASVPVQKYVEPVQKNAAYTEKKAPITNDDIAIIGISCRCAGAKDQEHFWQVVSQGKDCIQDLNKPQWLDYIASHCSETFPIRYGIMPELDYFDPLFFHISPREAEAMDATQRLLLEECYRALEDAGYNPSSLKKQAVGTYIGAMGGSSLGKGFSHLDMLGSETSILSARIAYFLDLKGPALTINTACSSSLVAIDVASRALKSGEINLAITGGVTLYQHPGTFIAMHNAGMLSPTGQCRPFDNAADGIVVGEGVGVVILKRLQDAERDRDSIYGIIRSCGINQDGQTSSMTVPSFLSQSELETSVYKKANINVEDLQYIEAHGTSTKLGDPIEIHALNKTFQTLTSKQKFCAIGSLKANVGHTTAAAGVLSVIKVLLSMKHQKLPPSIHFNEANRHIDFENSPVYVNTRLKPWPQNAEGSRLAAVSSFGFSGTNAHLVLEQYIPKSDANVSLFRSQVFLLSAESEQGLQNYAHNVKRYLEDHPALQFEHFLYTFQVGREAFTYRLALIVDNQQDLIEKLAQWLAGGGTTTGNSEKLDIGDTKDKKAFLQSLISAQKVNQLAHLWEQGVSVDWSVFYQPGKFRRLAGLPTYPFAREYFGDVQEEEAKQAPSSQRSTSLSSVETLICYPYWKEKTIATAVESFEYSRHLVFLCGMDHISGLNIQAQMPGVECVHLCSADILSSGIGLEKIYQDSFTQIFATIREILLSKTRGKIFIQCVVPQQTKQQCLSAISGMLKTAQLENPKVSGQLIEVAAYETEGSLLNKLSENGQCPEDKQIRYHQGQRTVLAWKELTVCDDACKTPWREGGVYLITGGAGGLGLIFAEEIANKTQSSTLILSGRSDLSLENKKYIFNRLQILGAKVEYWQADISNKNDVNTLIERITTEYGSLNGILHCAGMARDNFMIKKTSAEFQTVLSPKVAGVVHLDTASKDLNLDFLLLFSSISGTMGNAGQADYSTANAFMDAFSTYRNDLVNAGQRWGQTLSINWPLWQAGGMQLNDHSKAAMKQSVGLEMLDTAQGVKALVEGLASGQSQILVAVGDLPTLRQWLFPEPSVQKISDQSKAYVKRASSEYSLVQVEKQRLQEKTLMQLKSLLGETFRLAPDRIKTDDAFERYGIDSVMITQLNQELAKVFPEISKTLFFEYQTSQALVTYLIDEYPQECMVWTGLETETAICASQQRFAIAVSSLPESALTESQVLNKTTGLTLVSASNPQIQEAIAIIGVSAHFSQSDTLQAYWQNLQAGKDCIGEIPANRWPLEGFFVEDADQAIAQRKSYSKWGSFLESFADFDPLFFGIPPRDALSIDPHERLFLQSSWEALEDAGYTRDTLREIYQQQVGVFAGITKTGFDLYGPELWKRGEQTFPHTSFSSVSNRISYFLNLQGPSMSIDTMCSSSLIAIHEACERLRRQDCRLALAGGVNLYLHPSNYVQMCALRMLSKDGKCKAFGQGGNGFVPGEGVGVVLLKPLSAAIRDRDNIYAVIRASHVNHGGKTNGYTVPNPNAQADLISQTLKKAGIDARSISYIEAHGTGTELGDPIEITGLTQAFKKETADTRFCAIGSAKSNLGHLEAASGIAGLCKILLQLKHRQLVPSLHADDLNPNIAFDKTPFVVQQTLSEWKRPIIEINGQTKEYPRRAGISSFGAGGSNAHLIVEEYIETDECAEEDVNEPVLIVLSAKNTDQLIKIADNLRSFLIAETKVNPTLLEEIAYTLQTGREAMEERLAFIVSSLEELKNKLKSFIEGQENISSLYRGHVRQDLNFLSDFAIEAEFSTIIDEWIRSKEMSKLLNLWVGGLTIDWQKFYTKRKPRLISLPTYPFAKEYYWFNQPGFDQSNSDRNQNATEDSQASGSAHYLQKQWVVDLPQPDQLQHQKTVTGKIAILSTHETRLLATLLEEELPNSHVIELDNIGLYLEQSDADWNEYSGCIDLSGCCQGEAGRDSLDWMLWLQRLIEKGSKTGLTLLGITRGLESFQNSEVNLSGASRVGLYRMLQSEYAHVQSRHLDTAPHLKTAALAEQIAHEFWLNDNNCEICYRDQKRYRAYLAETSLKATKRQSTELQFAEEEVLLITGGTGGLGLLFAQHFVEHYGVKRLVLTGREALPPRDQWAALQTDKVKQKIYAIQALEAQGVRVQVLSLTLSDTVAVQESLHQITTNFGTIGGLLHCAGMVDSETPAFVRKSIASVVQVLEPKVAGLRSLLMQCKQQPLKFAVLFSSVSAIIPSLASGQSDYAMANTYMDYVAEAMAGVVVSIQWPSWQETGMGAANSRAYKETGLLCQSNQEGLQLLDNILAHKTRPVILPALVHSALWNPQQLMKHQSRRLSDSQVLNQNHQMPLKIESSIHSTASSKFTLDGLSDLFSQELGIAVQKLDLDKSFADYGLDSIWLAQLASKINQQLVEPMSPSILYEYSSLNSLASWLSSKQAPALKAKADNQVKPKNSEHAVQISPPRQTSQSPASGSVLPISSSKKTLDIAVVGMSCRFPGAKNVDEYWTLLSEGKNYIRPVPADRWSSPVSFYAGLIDNISNFDPAFFLIPKEDVKIMDPQALLVLEESLNLFYHAGYTLEEIKGRAIGVYLGARSQHRIDESDLYQARNPIVAAPNYIATNISQFFDLKGPSLVIDTACSSTLVGMNFAIQSLLSGEIDSAVVGGVSLLANENAHRIFQQRNLLNQDSSFHIFDRRASGVTLGEGAGLVLLKTLQQAQRDGDRIYAVIKGLAINNDGRTAGPATPNIKALKEVMDRALMQSAKQPQDIVHIEANGSGSEVTDLLELKAIEAVYRRENQTPCSLGSIKPNIGHPLCAEGIAGFIKLVCMLKYQQRVPFLSGQMPMMHYDIDSSPFYFCRQSSAWTEASPLVVALNCFADGGTNAHIIMENWSQVEYGKQRQPIQSPELKRVNIRGDMLVQEAVANEKVAQYIEEVNHNPWWGDGE
jgi:acyl transferase domain-containing protein/acyl carrier protein/SAM-dependent methyltransferase